MLYLIARLATDAYAIETRGICQIVPLAHLKSLPSSRPEVVGVLNYHGRAVPVLDLTRLLAGVASREQLGTRIILADVELPDSSSRLLGLLVEGAHAVERFDPLAFQPAGIRSDGAPWLGPVVTRGSELIQRLEIVGLLPPPVLAALLRDAQTSLAA